jgi:hypothetical protein
MRLDTPPLACKLDDVANFSASSPGRGNHFPREKDAVILSDQIEEFDILNRCRTVSKHHGLSGENLSGGS